LHKAVNAAEDAVCNGSKDIVSTTERSHESAKRLNGGDNHTTQADRAKRRGDGTAQPLVMQWISLKDTYRLNELAVGLGGTPTVPLMKYQVANKPEIVTCTVFLITMCVR
jgi:hypothetical protein